MAKFIAIDRANYAALKLLHGRELVMSRRILLYADVRLPLPYEEKYMTQVYSFSKLPTTHRGQTGFTIFAMDDPRYLK